MVRGFLSWSVLGLLLIAAVPTSAPAADPLPDPDGKPADMSKPVKVFVMMGQSNMLGFGKILGPDTEGSLEQATKKAGLYPYLVDDAGNWTVRNDVRNVRVMVGKAPKKGQQRNPNKPAYRVHMNDWLSVGGKAIGPEVGIGHQLGHLLDEPVMLLKSCIGNRSLGWDLLPPGSEGYEFESTDKATGAKKTYVYAGYKQSPMKWEKGTEPQPIGWYAGKQYDDDVANAKAVLDDLETFYPGAKGYEVAGFFWWQGDKDRYDAGLAGHYEQNLVNLIKTLRKEFNAPDAPFVLATLGQTKKGDGGTDCRFYMIFCPLFSAGIAC